MVWWGQGQTHKQINVMQWVGDEQQAVGASIILQPRPDPRLLCMATETHLWVLGPGLIQPSGPLGWATPQPRPPGLSGGMAITGGLGELSETWHPSHTLGPLPALLLERPVHLKPEHLPGAATPYSFARPVLSPQLVLKAAAEAG